MKFKVRTELSRLEDDPLEIWLQKVGDDVVLKCSGNWNILVLKADGTIINCVGLPIDLGFKINKNGQVNIINP